MPIYTSKKYYTLFSVDHKRIGEKVLLSDAKTDVLRTVFFNVGIKHSSYYIERSEGVAERWDIHEGGTDRMLGYLLPEEK